MGGFFVWCKIEINSNAVKRLNYNFIMTYYDFK
jgi:hypothetical protein